MILSRYKGCVFVFSPRECISACPAASLPGHGYPPPPRGHRVKSATHTCWTVYPGTYGSLNVGSDDFFAFFSACILRYARFPKQSVPPHRRGNNPHRRMVAFGLDYILYMLLNTLLQLGTLILRRPDPTALQNYPSKRTLGIKTHQKL